MVSKQELQTQLRKLERQVDRIGHDEIKVWLRPDQRRVLGRIARWESTNADGMLQKILDTGFPRGRSRDLKVYVRLPVDVLRAYSKALKASRRQGVQVRRISEVMCRNIDDWMHNWNVSVIDWLLAVVEDYETEIDENRTAIDSLSDQMTELYRELDLRKEEIEHRTDKVRELKDKLNGRDAKIADLQVRLQAALEAIEIPQQEETAV